MTALLKKPGRPRSILRDPDSTHHHRDPRAKCYFYCRLRCIIVMQQQGGQSDLSGSKEAAFVFFQGVLAQRLRVQRSADRDLGLHPPGGRHPFHQHLSSLTRPLPILASNVLANVVLQPVTSLTSDMKFMLKHGCISASFFIWHNRLEYIIWEAGRTGARQPFLCLARWPPSQAEGSSAPRDGSSHILVLSSLCYIKAQIEMT